MKKEKEGRLFGDISPWSRRDGEPPKHDRGKATPPRIIPAHQKRGLAPRCRPTGVLTYHQKRRVPPPPGAADGPWGGIPPKIYNGVIPPPHPLAPGSPIYWIILPPPVPVLSTQDYAPEPPRYPKGTPGAITRGKFPRYPTQPSMLPKYTQKYVLNPRQGRGELQRLVPKTPTPHRGDPPGPHTPTHHHHHAWRIKRPTDPSDYDGGPNKRVFSLCHIYKGAPRPERPSFEP